MYLRFITQFFNQDPEAKTGIFNALRFVAELSRPIVYKIIN